MHRESKRMKILSKSTAIKMKKVILDNKEKVLQEIRETKDLYELMLKWSDSGQLSSDEEAAVKSQLIDICKTIPALAVFMIPFGSILLAILIKFLPFNILPTAFKEEKDIN